MAVSLVSTGYCASFFFPSISHLSLNTAHTEHILNQGNVLDKQKFYKVFVSERAIETCPYRNHGPKQCVCTPPWKIQGLNETKQVPLLLSHDTSSLSSPFNYCHGNCRFSMLRLWKIHAALSLVALPPPWSNLVNPQKPKENKWFHRGVGGDDEQGIYVMEGWMGGGGVLWSSGDDFR